MTACVDSLGAVNLGRGDRNYVQWPLSGHTEAAVASVEFNRSGTWMTAEIGTNYVQGYFAGPDFSSPSPAYVVAASPAYCRVRIVDGPVTVIRDAGYIVLVP